MNWLPHKQLQKRWVSECGHYHRTVAHGVAGSVYDTWYHVGLPDFAHVGYSKDPEQLDRLVQFHAEHKLPAKAPTVKESP